MSSKEPPRTLPRVRLIEARKSLGLKRRQLANQLGLSEPYVYRVEEGWRSPSLANMIKWVTLLRCSMDVFHDDVSRAADDPDAGSPDADDVSCAA